jgi:antitoxin component YwqK of YwqJK toxin-antitoxin module
MKRYAPLIITAVVALSTTACRSYRQAEVVQETYIHKYGVAVPKEDWTRNGKDGQVVMLKNDGVTVSKTYQKGILDGKTTYTFPNSSTVAIVEQYAEGTLVSKTENYPSGVAKQQEKYAGELVAERLSWYEDGTPSTIERYENGLIATGEYRTPLNEIESKVSEGKGVRITRGNDGELLFKDVIEGGQMIERIAYFPNGEPSTVTPYKEGKIHGSRVTFLQGGVPNTVEEWTHGLQDGLTVVYLNGAKISELPYVKGKRHGIERRYRDGEILAEEVAWKNDRQHGERKILLDGNQSKTEWYHLGEVVSRATYERMNPLPLR